MAQLSLFLVLLSAAVLSSAQTARPSFSEPSLAPDRAEVAFVSGSDIWTSPLAGGEARLLVSHPATESRPVYSPDGSRLAFTSTRTGNGDVYLVTLATGHLRRLTHHEAPERVDGWSPDGRYVYFSSARSDVGTSDILRVNAEGGTPMPVSGDRYASEYFAAPAPIGDAMAFTARGVVGGQWWRKGHSHIDESEIWVRRSERHYERIAHGAKNAWPMWSPDAKKIYFMSDRSGAENLFEAPARQITSFKGGRVLWPSISRDGRTIVFERDFGIWQCDVRSGKAAPIVITLRGVPATPGVINSTVTSGFGSLALSPDGRKAAFVVRGDVFASPSKEAATATRLTNTPGLESRPVWLSDNRRVLYTSDRDGAPNIYLYDLSKNEESRLTTGTLAESSLVPSPDGKKVAFVRGGSRLLTLDLASKEEKELATGYMDLPPIEPSRSLAWSPDGKWIAFAATGDRGFRNMSVVPAAGGAPAIPVSFLPNGGSNSLSWSPDGKYLLFDTGQRTESGRVARVDLVPRTPKFREDQFRELFRDVAPVPAVVPNVLSQPATTPAAKPATPVAEPAKPLSTSEVRIVAEDVRRRLTLLPLGLDVEWQRISPDGKTLLLIASAAGQQNFWSYSLDELATEPATPRQVTSTSGSKSPAWFSPDSKEIYYLENGRLHVLTLENRQARPISITAEVQIDFEKDRDAVFRQSWTYLRDHFYDEKFHGVDWTAVRERVAPYVSGARTPDELRRVLSLAIGELNASHLGISGPPSGNVTSGAVGLRFNRHTYEAQGHLKIEEVIRLSPADVAGVKAGEYLVAVDDTPLDARSSIDELLEHKTGKRVVLRVASGAGETGREVVVLPIGGRQEASLLYRQWVEDRRAYVARVSNGRLGYVHMPDMSAASLDQLYIDLDTENQGREGVVIDLRNNNGGFVNVYALDVLARRPFLNMTPRGWPTMPARSALGQRALEKPTVLVVNRESLSDAEDFTEGYRAMKLGRVVGEPTAGWIIYTWNTGLIDGSMLRLPRMKITDARGVNMELNPRPVDVPVTRAMGESYTGRDTQLDVAARELLRDLDAAKQSVNSGSR